MTESFPRRYARTRRFTLGAPRSFVIPAEGERVLFLRSLGGDDPVNRLWELDIATGQERTVADPNAYHSGDDTDLPPAERARRERARESADGIVAFDTDGAGRQAVFALGGGLWLCDIGAGTSRPLPSEPGAYDPRLDSTGSRVAYVAADTLRVIELEADADHLLLSDDDPNVSWGAAEFIAGEEMGRSRGHWWSPDGTRLLAEWVDVSPVPVWHIAAPVTPAAEPMAVRYPHAGAANAVVGLAIADLNGDLTAVTWDSQAFPYLARVSWTDHQPLITVQSRDQRTLIVLDIDPTDGSTTERWRDTDPDWVELAPGVPRTADGRLVTLADREGARRLMVNGQVLSPDGLQVRSVLGHDADGIFVTATTEPTEQHVFHIGWEGGGEGMTAEPGVHTATVGSGHLVLQSAITGQVRTSVRVVTVEGGPDRGPAIDNQAADPELELNIRFLELGERRLRAALLLPRPEVDPGGRLPILLDPYGGPHAQRVLRNHGGHLTSQWFADQGFAVLVIDNRGTPARGPEWERSVRGDLAAPVLEDQIDGLDAALAIEPRLDPNRVAIRGWSFGGYLAALAAVRRPDRIHAAIAGAPVTDWRLYDSHYTERYLGHPDHEPGNYERTDLCAHAHLLERPLLLIHGLADDNVVVAHTLTLSQALLEHGRPHRFLPLSGVTHMTPQEVVAENLLLLQVEFLNEVLSSP
ncbi:MAG: S9 family peptidase [Actinomycetia bacterium]|nr:S9 family peptidase [Actinomycetes bacterium]